MFDVKYDDAATVQPQELRDFYGRVQHDIAASPEQLHRMVGNSAVFVAARVDGRLIGIARGVCDGLRGYFTECKLDPQYQGPAAVTRTDGRIEHDAHGIAAEMARRVIASLQRDDVRRIDVLAYGTEVDFLEELGFKRVAGLVGLTLRAEDCAAARPKAGATAS